MGSGPPFGNKKDTAKGDVFFVGGGRWIRILLGVSIITFQAEIVRLNFDNRSFSLHSVYSFYLSFIVIVVVVVVNALTSITFLFSRFLFS